MGFSSGVRWYARSSDLRIWKIYPEATHDQFRHGKADGQRSCWQFALWKAGSFRGGACWWSQQNFLAEGEKAIIDLPEGLTKAVQRDQMQNNLLTLRLEDSSVPCGRLVWCIVVIPSKLQATWAWPSYEQQTCCDDLLWWGWLIGGNLNDPGSLQQWKWFHGCDSGCACGCGCCRCLFVCLFVCLIVWFFDVLFVRLLASLFCCFLVWLVGGLVGLLLWF